MMTLIVPKLLDIFDDKSTLPASTKALIAVSDLFINYWLLFIIIAFVIYVGVKIWKKTPD
jgi:type IV pilus assembly protein PilC